MFNPAHDALVLFLPEAGSITESTDGLTPATFTVASPALPTTTAGIMGYTDLPDTSDGLNNEKGYAAGVQGAVYTKRGRREPSITVNVRPGNMASLAYLFPDATTGRFTPLTIFVQVKGSHIDVYRFCKPGTLAINPGGGDGQGGETVFSVTFQAIAKYSIASAAFPAPSVIRAMNDPLMWHDFRSFIIQGTQYRKGLMNFTINLDMGLEGKNQRPNWGDDSPLSNTRYDLLEHHKTITGEVTLHERLPQSLFTGGNRAQNWGDIPILFSNTPGGGDKGFSLIVVGVVPQNQTMPGGESSREIDYTVPILADDLIYSATDPGEEE